MERLSRLGHAWLSWLAADALSGVVSPRPVALFAARRGEGVAPIAVSYGVGPIAPHIKPVNHHARLAARKVQGIVSNDNLRGRAIGALP